MASEETGSRVRRVVMLVLCGWLAVLVHWAFLGLAIWIILLGVLENRGTLDRWNATRVLGFILMLRTSRGQVVLEWISRPRRLWRVFGQIGLWTCGVAMVLIILILLLSFIGAILTFGQVEPLPPSQLVLIPGVNPMLPFWWPALAIIGALVIHEYGHAIQARAHGMRIRSFGLLMLGPLPLGAFAEPQNNEVMKAPRNERARMFAAGPAVNLYAAAITWLIIAALASQFVAINPGIHAAAVVEDAPADEAGLQAWDIITKFGDDPVASQSEMSAAIQNRSAGESVELQIVGQDEPITVILGDRYEYFLSQNVSNETLVAAGVEKGDAFLGISGYGGGTTGIDRIAGPFAADDRSLGASALQTLLQPVTIIAIPVQFEGQIMAPQELDMIEASGPLGDLLGTEVMLMLITAMFWFVWMNLGLGFANLIPMVPFDGGHLFRDWLHDKIDRLSRFSSNPHPLQTEHLAQRISSMSSLVLLIALLLMIITPYL
jgi:membrane-associated protease RseP (regulator of RpoE activity)